MHLLQLLFDIFLKGATEGVDISLKIFPTLIGLFVAIGMLRSSGILDFISNLISPILTYIKFPSEIMPLALLRPISGSASMAIANSYKANFPTQEACFFAEMPEGSTYTVTCGFAAGIVTTVRFR